MTATCWNLAYSFVYMEHVKRCRAADRKEPASRASFGQPWRHPDNLNAAARKHGLEDFAAMNPGGDRVVAKSIVLMRQDGMPLVRKMPRLCNACRMTHSSCRFWPQVVKI